MSLFDNADIISRYSDEEAVDDGVLADISAWGVRHIGRPVNRMTRNLFESLRPYSEPMSACGRHMLSATEGFTADCDDCQTAFGMHMESTLRTKLKLAVDTAEEGEERGYLFKLPGRDDDGIWLIGNELGGFTVMFPEDY